jgi:pimeloyl-ACP methyl ester carboxylesterase
MKKWIAGLIVLACSMSFTSAHGKVKTQDMDKTVVLVHGAFADGTGTWDKVIPMLQAHGLKVIAVQNPLTSMADDVAATRRAINRATGQVILVGHSWGGVVITEMIQK